MLLQVHVAPVQGEHLPEPKAVHPSGEWDVDATGRFAVTGSVLRVDGLEDYAGAPWTDEATFFVGDGWMGFPALLPLAPSTEGPVGRWEGVRTTLEQTHTMTVSFDREGGAELAWDPTPYEYDHARGEWSPHAEPNYDYEVEYVHPDELNVSSRIEYVHRDDVLNQRVWVEQP